MRIPFKEPCQWPLWIRMPLLGGLAIVIWLFGSKAIQDLIVWGAFLYALCHCREGAALWDCRPGRWMIGVFLFVLFTLPLSSSPGESLRDFVRNLDVFAGAFAITVLFSTREKLDRALTYTAAAFTAVAAWNLARLAAVHGGEMLLRAHGAPDLFFGHPSNDSMASAAAAIILGIRAWQLRARRGPAAACVAALGLNLAHILVLGSRGAQLAFAGAAAVSGLVLLPGRRARWVWAAAVAAAGVLAVVNVVRINPRFVEVQSMRNLSERDHVWKHTWRLAWERPVTGYGYGRKLFGLIYYGSEPPKSRFHFPHAHEYWLNIFFSHGLIGLVIFATAWTLLFRRLWRRTREGLTFEARAGPGAILLILILLHIYGLGDQPDSVVYSMLVWSIPAALTMTRELEPAEADVSPG